MLGTIEIFISYARQDRRLKDKLVEHLSLLKQQGYIAVWYDQDISAGVEWQQSIREHLGKVLEVNFDTIILYSSMTMDRLIDYPLHS